VLLDNTTRCLTAESLPLHDFSSLDIEEALVLHGVVAITRDKGFDKAIFISDCLSMIKHLNSPTLDCSHVC
jgi:hypothetical protein